VVHAVIALTAKFDHAVQHRDLGHATRCLTAQLAIVLPMHELPEAC